MTDTTTTTTKAQATALAAIGAVGTFDEWIGQHADRFFTELIGVADEALTKVRPTIATYRADWCEANAKPADRFGLAEWISWTASVAKRDDAEAWSPSKLARERMGMLWTLAEHGHGKATMAKYLAVATMDDSGRYGVRDINGYLAWLPSAADYDDDGFYTAEAQERDANKAAERLAADIAKANASVIGYAWDTVAASCTLTGQAKDEWLAGMLHDFTSYVTTTIASHGDAEYVRKVNRQVSDTVKARKAKVTKADVRAARKIIDARNAS